jgi:hypothetical protein
MLRLWPAMPTVLFLPTDILWMTAALPNRLMI